MTCEPFRPDAPVDLTALRAMIAGDNRPPVCDLLDFTFTEADDGWVAITGAPTRRAYNPIGTVHGGCA